MNWTTLALIIITTAGFINESRADEIYSGNNCDRNPHFDHRSICRGGRQIPHNTARNKGPSVLECTGNVDHYVRHPQRNLNVYEVMNKLGADQHELIQKELRESVPDIEWEGTIPYKTVEVWNYQKCTRVQNIPECGSHTDQQEVCEQVTDYDSEGNASGSHEECHIEHYEHANSCDVERTHTESWDCSHERTKFTAKFKRPDVKDWNYKAHKSQGYYHVIPNKYDLLPGEQEDVQIYNNGGRSTRMTPSVQIGDAWNDYNLKDITGSGVSAACVQDATYQINVTIHTNKRNTGKASPNALRLATDSKGNALPVDKVLKWNYDDNDEKTYPAFIRIEDTSAGTVKLISKESRATGKIQKEKEKQGKGGTKAEEGKVFKEEERRFLKNTMVWVQIVEVPVYWFDDVWVDAETSDEEVVMSSNVSATDMTKKESDTWKIKLDADELKADRHHRLEISMYQKGVPFYKQSCEDEMDPEKRDGCGWYQSIGLGRDKGDYFSKPLVVKFTTPKTYGKGPGFFGSSDTFMHWLFGGTK